MPSERGISADSAAYRKFRRIQNRLSWILISALVGLALAFDLLSVYAKGFMGAPLAQGGVISVGMAMALVIVLVILAAALYYVVRINSAYLEMHGSPDDD